MKTCRAVCAVCIPAGAEALTIGLIARAACSACGFTFEPDRISYYSLEELARVGLPDTNVMNSEPPPEFVSSQGMKIEFSNTISPVGPFELPLPGPHSPIAPPRRVLSRGWTDFGLDTGPRLRVKELRDMPGPPPAVADDTQDPGDWRERNRRYRRAMAEGDDATISRMFPHVLDLLHSEAPRPKLAPFSWAELEPAFLAELREWGRARQLAAGELGFMRFFDGSSAVRVPIPNVPGEFHEIRLPRLAVVSAWRDAGGNARYAAGILGSRVDSAYREARASDVITVPDAPALN